LSPGAPRPRGPAGSSAQRVPPPAFFFARQQEAPAPPPWAAEFPPGPHRSRGPRRPPRWSRQQVRQTAVSGRLRVPWYSQARFPPVRERPPGYKFEYARGRQSATGGFLKIGSSRRNPPALCGQQARQMPETFSPLLYHRGRHQALALGREIRTAEPFRPIPVPSSGPSFPRFLPRVSLSWSLRPPGGTMGRKRQLRADTLAGPPGPVGPPIRAKNPVPSNLPPSADRRTPP